MKNTTFFKSIFVKKEFRRWVSPVGCLLFLLMGQMAFAQGYVTLGTQDTQSGNTSPGVSNGYYTSRKIQVVYPAAELLAGGAAAGNIERLAWDVAVLYAGAPLPNYTIKMGHITTTDIPTTTFITGLTTVKTAYDYTPALGFNDITFDTPFNWNGVDNIIVDICFSEAPYVSPYGQNWNYPGVSNSWRSRQVDGSDLCEATTANQAYSVKPRVRFYMQLQPPCNGTPEGGTVSTTLNNFVCSGATLSAINVTGASAPVPGISYQWEESTTGGTSWGNATGGTGATTTSYTPPAFAGSAIQYRLKVTCANGGAVDYADVVSFNPQAAPLTQASALTVTNQAFSAFTANWTNGSGTRRYVVVSTSPIVDPVSGSAVPAYTAASAWANAGQQIVYDGTGTSVTVTGLTCGTTYYIKVYEYSRCGSGPYDVYFNTTAGTNSATATSPLTSAAELPITVDFTGFTGDNLGTIFPGWFEAAGTGADNTPPGQANPTGNTSGWVNSTNTGVPSAKFNLYLGSQNGWLVSPKIAITDNSRLKFKAAITDYNGSGADAAGMQGTDDKVKVLISTDGCGATWTTLYTFEAANTTTLSNTLQDFTINLGPDYVGDMVQIAFQATDGPLNEGPDYDFHITNILLEELPACDVPVLNATEDVTKNGATISWTAPTVGVPTGYEYVVTTTEGTPAADGTETEETEVELTGLTASTTYYVYARTICTDVYSDWTEAGTFTTMCDYADILTTTGDSVCGQGIAELSATVSEDGVLKWYAAETGGAALGTGATFTTPLLTETTNYYVSGGNVYAGTDVAVGAGASTSSSGGYSPFYHGWGGVKTQFIITAAEMQMAGIYAGPINSVAFTVTGLGTSYEDFAVSIGTTTQSVATNTHIDGLTPVYSSAAYTPTMGLNVFEFTTPFVWDGTSNIVVQTCYHDVDNPTGGTSATVQYDTTSYVASTYTYADSQSAAAVCAATTGSVGGSGGTATQSARAKMTFNATAICESPRVMVTATVTDAPDVELSASEMTICNGESTDLSVESENAGYTYVWVPGNLTGAEQTVSPTATTTYTVTATDETTGCVEVGSITITVNPLPTIIDAEEDFAVCEGGIEELSATGGLIVMTAHTEAFETAPANFAITNTAGTGTAVANATYFTEGAGSVLFNVNTNNANVSYGMNADVDMTDYASAQLSFSHIVAMEGGGDYSYDIGYVEYSADGGETWTTFPSSSYAGSGTLITTQGTATPVSGVIFSTRSYTDWKATFTGSASTPGTGPAATLWKNETINIPAAALTSEFRVRFRVTTDVSVNYYGWLIDNLKISGETQNVVWSPTTGLYTDAAGTVAYTGQNMPTVYVKPTVTTTYTATATTLVGCSVSDTVDVTITVKPAPEADAEQTFCGGATIADLTTTNVEVVDHWYYTPAGGSEIDPSTILLDNTTYYVSQTLDGCESVARTMVSVTVNTIDAPTVEEDIQTFCNAATLADIEIDGEGIQWYTSMTGGEALEADTEISEGISIFFASQTVDGCESVSRTAVVTELNITNAPDAEEAQTFCNAATVADLMAEGEMIMWYDAEDNMLEADDALVNGGVYYASQTINGCESSEMAMVTVTINAPAAPTGDTDQEVCEGSTIADLALDNEMLTWYTAAEGGDMLDSETALENGVVYYASQWVDGCESIARLGVTVTMITVTVDTPADVTECNSYILPVLVNGAYYAEANGGGEAIAAGTEITETTTLYVYATGGTEAVCTAEHTFTITINTAADPSGEASQSVEITAGEEATIADLVVTTEGEGTVTWYASEENAASGTDPLSMDTVIEDGATYYAVFTSGDCASGSFGVTVDVVLGNKGFDMTTFTYHPNPVRNVLNIAYSSEITSVTVFNLLGQQVIAQQPNATEVKVDMSGLADGTYVINVTSGNTVNTFKVVKHNN